MCPYRQINKHLPTIRKIPDDLWDEIKQLLPEKKDKTIGRPVIPFRKVLDGIQRLVMTVDALLHICHAMKCNIWYYKTES
jgi:hypothetical protein